MNELHQNCVRAKIERRLTLSKQAALCGEVQIPMQDGDSATEVLEMAIP
jgi:hypothetical protein